MKRFILPVLFFLLVWTNITPAQTIQSPEKTFGFKMGTDRKLINWQQIHDYFRMLDANSNRLKLVELGKTTLNRPMLMAIIGSAETMHSLDKYKSIQQKLGRPYTIESDAAQTLIREGKLVLLITMNIHSTEIAASQESVELAYELVTSETPDVQNIRDKVIILMVPSLNPDGQDMVTKWYLKDVDTDYEGSRMPMKYHFYADHDNNRDWFFFNLAESRHVAKVLYHDWYPEIVMDQHQMGSRGARLFLPPYADPVNPNVQPSLMANVNMLGKHVVADMHDAGFTGLVTGTIFNAFFEGTMSKTPLWHNRIGILTEAASVNIASPVFFPKTSLHGMGIDLPEYSQQTNFLAPWPGGWWHLRDIIEYEKAATYSILKLAATYKTKFKQNFYRLNKQAITEGQTKAPYAYLIPPGQNDPNNAVEMLKRLRIANVDIYEAQENFHTTRGDFPEGTFIIPLAQPGRAYIKDLMEIQQYPNLREYPGGPPRQPYDVTAWTLPLQFDVKTLALDNPLHVKMKKVDPQLTITSTVEPGYVAVERRFNHSYKLINSLAQSGVPIHQLSKDWQQLKRGTFIINATTKNLHLIQQKCKELQVPVGKIADSAGMPVTPVKEARIAIYQPWLPWVYDEGWLRLVLDNFGFKYSILHNEDFTKLKNLRDKFDILIFGSEGSSWIVNGKGEKQSAPRLGEPKIRKQYKGGIGKDGTRIAQLFMKTGGRVLFLGDACNFAIDELHLPVDNPLKSVKRKDYFAPGSFFEVTLDPYSKLTYGMSNKMAIYKNSNLVLSCRPALRTIVETAMFGEHDVLSSGWAVGEKKLYGRAALVEIPFGKGEAILYAFRVQHRAQTYGTFKLLFNALYL